MLPPEQELAITREELARARTYLASKERAPHEDRVTNRELWETQLQASREYVKALENIVADIEAELEAAAA